MPIDELGPEQVYLRTATSQTFEQPDGSFVTHFFTRPLFYQVDGSANWLPIDLRFTAVPGNGPNARVDTAPIGLALRAADSPEGFLTSDNGQHAVSLLFPSGVAAGRAGTKAAISADRRYADFADFLPGNIGLRVFAASNGVRTFLVLTERPADSTFRFAIDAPGLTATSDADGAVLLSDSAGLVVARLPRPYMVDSSVDELRGAGAYSEAVSQTLSTQAGQSIVQLAIDPLFLDSATYPVYLDPAVTWDIPDDGGSASDTFVTSKYPSSNFDSYLRPNPPPGDPAYYEMWLGREPGTTYDSETFIRFDGLYSLLGAGNPVHVDQANIWLWPYHQYYGSTPRPTWIDRVTTSWAASTLNWNNKPGSSSYAAIGQFDTAEDVWGAFTVTDVVRDVVTGVIATDNGYRLHENGTGEGNWKRVVARENATLKPYLAVTWHRPSATPLAPVGGATGGRTLSWTYANGDATYGTPQSHYWVQVATDAAFGAGTIVRETYAGTFVAGTAAAWSFGVSGTPMNYGSTYYWRVKVKDGYGESAWSSAASFVFTDNALRGEEGYYARVPFDLGGGWRMAVGVNNGELALDRHLLEIPSFGPPQSMSLSYSSHNNASAYLGTGWSSNLTQRLTFATNTVFWLRPDNGVVKFTWNGTAWTTAAGHYETLTAGTGEYIVTLKDQNRLVFESTGSGRLKRVENRFGSALTLIWGTSSATATDASGRVMNIVIAGGLITSVTDSAGRAWGFAYTSGKLTSVTDPAGNITTLGYANGYLTSVSRVSGTVIWSVAYTNGRVTGVTDPIDSTVANTFSYGSTQTTVGLVKTYSGPVRNTWAYTYDSLGRNTATLDPEGFTTSYAYDASSNLTQLTLPISKAPDPVTNQLISYTYDARGNVLTQTTQLTSTSSVVTAMSYNATNDLLTRSEADNDASLKLVTKYTYDAAGHLTSLNVNCTTSGTTPPVSASTCTGAGTQNASTNLITAYTYTANDQLETETDPLGRVTKHVYDASGNETEAIANYVAGQSATAERNVTTTFAYNQATTAGKAGLATSTTDPLGYVTTYAYDAMARQTSETLSGDSSNPALTRSTTYDAFGNALTATESWTGVTRTTTHAYDKLNRETTVTDPAGVEASTEYDAAGNAILSTSNGVTTTRTFDGLGSFTEEQIGSSTTTSSFDGQSREVQRTDPASVTMSATYDLAGRLTEERVESSAGDLVTSYSYDLLDRQISTTAPGNLTTTSTYDRAGRMISTSVAGSTTSYTYDRAGNQVSETGPDGTLTTTQYDALNRPTVVIANDVATPDEPTEDVTTTTYYDAAGQTVAVQDDSLTTTRSIYNPRGLVSQSLANCTDSGTTPTTNPAACTGAGTHDAATNVVTVTSYDGSGATTMVVSAQGSGAAEATVEYAYDAAGRQQAVKDARGTVTRTRYDNVGRVNETIVNCTESTSNPVPPSTNWWTCDGSTVNDGTWNVKTLRSYDTHGNVTSETAPNGRVTTYVYDSAERLIQRIDNDVSDAQPAADEDLSTYYAYDDTGHQSAVRAPTANRTTFAVTRYVYDASGRLTQEIRNCTDSGTTAPGDPAWKTCSGSGTKDADTNLTTTYGYDSRGNRASVTGPDPSATTGTSIATVTTRYAYDVENSLCGVLENATVQLASPDPCATSVSGTAAQNVWTRYTYDALGNLKTMVDGRGNTTTYGYDALGRMNSLTDALGKTTAWTFDRLGRRVSQTRRGVQPQSTLVSWAYDAAGRMTSRVAGGQTTTYAYDDNGNRTSAAITSGTISATYDRLNRPLSVTNSADTGAPTNYTYSLTSPSWTDPSGAYSVTLDKFDRQVALTDPVHGATPFTFAYRADGQQSTIGAPNGNTTTFAYDDAGAAASKITAAGQTTRASYAWTSNRASQILSEVSTITGDPSNGTTTFGYDQLGRLTGSTRGIFVRGYGWQAVPNRSSVQVGDAAPVSTTFDAANRPTTDTAGGSYSTDAEGRLTTRPGQVFEWDDLGRLTAVNDASTQAEIATYTYDALDRLLTADHGGMDVVRFRYVGLTTSVAQVVTPTNTSIYKIANGWDGQRLFEWTTSTQAFYGTNGHGDVTWIAGSTGAVSATIRYDPWGTLSNSTGTYLPSFRFQGSWFDPTVNLSWIVARWYVPALGRFLSEDTLLGQVEEPPSRHLYTYGAGDPVLNVDLDGHRISKSKLYRIRNTAGFKGRLLLQFFIHAKYNYATALGGLGVDSPVDSIFWRLYGDNRSFGGDCNRSRVCVAVNFDARYVLVTISDSCGDFAGPSLLDWWLDYKCVPAHTIYADPPRIVEKDGKWGPIEQNFNQFAVSEGRFGQLYMSWSITQSRIDILRPSGTVEGRMWINPFGRVDLWTDGFPSEEMYSFGAGRSGPYRPHVLLQWYEREPEAWKDMRPGRGDRYTRLTLPSQNMPR